MSLFLIQLTINFTLKACKGIIKFAPNVALKSFCSHMLFNHKMDTFCPSHVSDNNVRDKLTCAGVTEEPLAASSLALFIHPAAASAGLSAAFFDCPDSGGNPAVLVPGWVGDLGFAGEGLGAAFVSVGDGLGAALLLVGEGLGAGLLSVGEGLGAGLLSTAAGFAVDCFISSRNFSASAVCFFCASNEI